MVDRVGYSNWIHTLPDEEVAKEYERYKEWTNKDEQALFEIAESHYKRRQSEQRKQAKLNERERLDRAFAKEYTETVKRWMREGVTRRSIGGHKTQYSYKDELLLEWVSEISVEELWKKLRTADEQFMRRRN